MTQVRGESDTLKESRGELCWYRISQVSRYPSSRLTRRTEGRLGLQHPSDRREVEELLVHRMGLLEMSSDQTLAFQSPTVRKCYEVFKLFKALIINYTKNILYLAAEIQKYSSPSERLDFFEGNEQHRNELYRPC